MKKFFGQLKWKNIFDNIFLMVFFGAISYTFGLVNFTIPGVVDARSNLAEIPLLIGLFHVGNPWVGIGMSLISALNSLTYVAFYSAFIMHSVALLVSWVIYERLGKLQLKTYTLGIIWFFYVFVYYYALLLPLFVLTYFAMGINLEKSFCSFYWELIISTRLELIATAIVSSMYLLQHKLKVSLKYHTDNLEVIVQQRTEALNNIIEELKTTQKQLVQSEKMASLGTLTAGIAHEINNPLNFISGGIMIISDIKEEINSNNAEVKKDFDEAINMIEAGLVRATKIVKALMTFAYRGTSKLVYFDIHEIIENTLLFLNFQLPNDLVIKKDYRLKNQVPIFAEKMHQVVMAIIENALYELNSANLSQKILIISTIEKNGKAMLRFSNNGNKIPEDLLTRIFDPFFTTKSTGHGTGLGLSICYTYIQEHGGQITAENTNDGVSFIVELPLKK